MINSSDFIIAVSGSECDNVNKTVEYAQISRKPVWLIDSNTSLVEVIS